MSNGLYSGVSGLALGVGLYKDVSGLWSGANGLISGFGGDGSTLSLNFINAVYEAAMTAYNFQQLINFTRTSSATFVGSNGLIQNTPQSRNLLTFTQQFDVATAWGNSITGTGVAPTVTANDGTAPDGTPTADRLQFSLGGGTASGDVTRRRQAITTPATLQTFSMYLRSYDGVSTYNMHLVDAAGATRNIVVTGAWQRFEVTATGTNTSVSFAVGLRGAQTPANSNTADVLAWGAQVEEVPAANETLGSELRSAGAIGLIGTATAATYNTTTGVGSATRVDLANQSFVQWSGLSANPYKLVISCDSGPGIFVRSGGAGGSSLVTVAVGTSATIDVLPSTGLITITSSNTGTSTFTLTSIREITAITGMPSPYTRNVGGLFPARFDYNPITLQPRGILIEEQRTNLLTYSAQFDDAVWVKANVTVTPNTTIAPDGTLTGDTITGVVPGANNSVHQVYVSAGQVLTYTIRVRAGTATTCGLLLRDNTGNTNLAVSASILSGPGAVSGASVLAVSGLSTTEWTTVALTTTAATISGNQIRAFFYPETATAAATTGKSNVVWGAQLEAGAFATSYIPTVASQVTRTADQASIEAPMFAPWYNQTEGAFVASFDMAGGSAASAFLRAVLSARESATSSNNIYNGSGQVTAWTVLSSVDQAFLTTGAVATDTVTNIAYAYKANDFAASRNGGTVVTDPSGALPSPTILGIGGNTAGSLFLSGHIRSIKYYPTRLSNAQLQALST